MQGEAGRAVVEIDLGDFLVAYHCVAACVGKMAGLCDAVADETLRKKMSAAEAQAWDAMEGLRGLVDDNVEVVSE